jgi:hypothetical protein
MTTEDHRDPLGSVNDFSLCEPDISVAIIQQATFLQYPTSIHTDQWPWKQHFVRWPMTTSKCQQDCRPMSEYYRLNTYSGILLCRISMDSKYDKLYLPRNYISMASESVKNVYLPQNTTVISMASTFWFFRIVGKHLHSVTTHKTTIHKKTL